VEFKPDDRVLDLGCGIGLISLTALDAGVSSVVSIDISLEAVRNTQENLQRNGYAKYASVIQSDLLSALDTEAQFSLIAFNPPYLPEEDNHSDMDHALIGGREGTETTLRFLDQAIDHLKPGGRVYIVVSSLANSKAVKKRMIQLGLKVEHAREQKMFFEQLSILRGVLST
jgi:release factor glutamine methyltransferase